MNSPSGRMTFDVGGVTHVVLNDGSVSISSELGPYAIPISFEVVVIPFDAIELIFY